MANCTHVLQQHSRPPLDFFPSRIPPFPGEGTAASGAELERARGCATARVGDFLWGHETRAPGKKEEGRRPPKAVFREARASFSGRNWKCRFSDGGDRRRWRRSRFCRPKSTWATERRLSCWVFVVVENRISGKHVYALNTIKPLKSKHTCTHTNLKILKSYFMNGRTRRSTSAYILGSWWHSGSLLCWWQNV